MRRSDKQVDDQNIIREILQKGNVCRIAFSVENIPYIVPVNYGYLNNRLYIHSSPKGQKIELIKQNKHICFEIECPYEIIRGELPCDWTTKYRSIIGRGIISIISETEEKKSGMDIIMRAHGGQGALTYQDRLINRMVILQIEITELSAKQSGNW